jgi:hypothetical protein
MSFFPAPRAYDEKKNIQLVIRSSQFFQSALRSSHFLDLDLIPTPCTKCPKMDTALQYGHYF